MKKVIVVVIILVAGGLAYLLSEKIPGPMKNINEFLSDQVEQGKSPAVQYAFFGIDSIIYEGQSGVSNVKSNTPVNAATTYNLFSVTKTFTALAVLQLAQDGKIQLDAPAAGYLPGFPYSEKITVRQLLNHSSGIPNPLPLRWIHLASEHKKFNRDQFFRDIFNENPKLKAEPGTKFKYSNLGYVLLGQLIEKVSAQTYEDYITKHILEPAGIAPGELSFEIDSSVHATGYQKWRSFTNAVLGFMIDKEKFMGEKEGAWKPFENFYTNGISYGGMVGSAGGLIRYAQALLQKQSLLINDEYRRVLLTESVINGKPTGMSLSWYTGKLKGHPYYAHAGGGGGYYVELRIYPDLGTGSVILFNRSGMTDERILDQADIFFLDGRIGG